MFLKCPRCKDRSVLEQEVSRLTWERTCTAEDCKFVYTISAVTEIDMRFANKDERELVTQLGHLEDILFDLSPSSHQIRFS